MQPICVGFQNCKREIVATVGTIAISGTGGIDTTDSGSGSSDHQYNLSCNRDEIMNLLSTEL